jgi:hypothetical protein
LGAVDPRPGGQEDARPAPVPYLGVPLASGRPSPFSPPWQAACGHPSFRPAPLPPSTCLPACLMCLPPSSRLSSAAHVVVRSFFLPYVLSHALPAILMVGCSVAVLFAASVYVRLTVDMLPPLVGMPALREGMLASNHALGGQNGRQPFGRRSTAAEAVLLRGRLEAGQAAAVPARLGQPHATSTTIRPAPSRHPSSQYISSRQIRPVYDPVPHHG